MIPIQDLLHRLRWDPGFAAASFEIGYYDRVLEEVVRVRFEDLPDDLPLHRIREVWRDGVCIWRRPEPPPRP